MTAKTLIQVQVCHAYRSEDKLGVQEFYQEMQKSLAMLTLFPGDCCYKDATSSTAATAIVAQIPLIVGPKFLEVYSFVPGPVIVADVTSHATALQQILNMESWEWNELALEVPI